MQHHDGRRLGRPRPDHAVLKPQRSKLEEAFVGERHALRSPPTARRCAAACGKALLDRIAGRIDFGFGARIIGAARFQDRHQISHGLAILRHRAKITLRHDPAHVLLRPRLDPDGVGVAKQQRVGFRIGDDAAGRGDHRGLVLGEHALERALSWRRNVAVPAISIRSGMLAP